MHKLVASRFQREWFQHSYMDCPGPLLECATSPAASRIGNRWNHWEPGAGSQRRSARLQRELLARSGPSALREDHDLPLLANRSFALAQQMAHCARAAAAIHSDHAGQRHQGTEKGDPQQLMLQDITAAGDQREPDEGVECRLMR